MPVPGKSAPAMQIFSVGESSNGFVDLIPTNGRPAGQTYTSGLYGSDCLHSDNDDYNNLLNMRDRYIDISEQCGGGIYAT